MNQASNPKQQIRGYYPMRRSSVPGRVLYSGLDPWWLRHQTLLRHGEGTLEPNPDKLACWNKNNISLRYKFNECPHLSMWIQGGLDLPSVQSWKIYSFWSFQIRSRGSMLRSMQVKAEGRYWINICGWGTVLYNDAVHGSEPNPNQAVEGIITL